VSHAKVLMDYLSEAGVTRENMVFSKVGDKVHVSMPVKVANKALNTEFALFRSNLKSDVVLARITKPYYLPTHVAEVVSFVDDILRFPSLDKIHHGKPDNKPSSLKAASSSPFNSCGSGCAGFTTPAVLSERYGFSTMKSAANGNSMAVPEFQYQYYDTADLNQFSKSCVVPAVTVQTTYGGNQPSFCKFGFCTEALLDIEYIKAVANAVPLTVFYSTNYSILNWINQVLSLKNPPLVHSVSYGNDEVQQTSAQYMYSCNVQFMAAGVRGLSILIASGDQGVWGRTGPGAMFNPDFPASSPYVTAVGGTDFKTKSVIGPETAWNCGGGGFSNTFRRPSWQSKAVTDYLKTASLPPSSYYNATGRGYPDVSALGGLTNLYCTAFSGSLRGVAGTSASTSVVAGIVAQLNDIRLQKGKKSLGFLNPLLYANPKCFYDVNDGSNNACDGSYFCDGSNNTCDWSYACDGACDGSFNDCAHFFKYGSNITHHGFVALNGW